ncbi:MAG: NifB/NifX family molybdenum-iron cluster-binding protein [Spirochaetia bacterium]
MKIAIPTAQGRLCPHFGHCETFSIFEIEDNNIVSSESLTPPPHEPGVLPKWLHEQGATAIIAGGMGRRAQDLFSQNDITVIVGAESKAPDKVVNDYLSGKLETGNNLCDH